MCPAVAALCVELGVGGVESISDALVDGLGLPFNAAGADHEQDGEAVPVEVPPRTADGWSSRLL